MTLPFFYDLDFADRAACSTADLAECEDVINRIIDLSETARSEGLLSLEDRMFDVPQFLLRKGLELIVDGTDPERVFRILSTYIFSTPLRGKELLIRCIITEGVLAIQSGDNARIVRDRLVAFLGENRASELVDVKKPEQPTEQELRQRVADFLSAHENKKAICRAARKLGRELVQLDSRSVERLLAELEKNDITAFLYGADGALIRMVLSCMSLHTAASTVLSVEIHGHLPGKNVASVKRACRRIDNVVQKCFEAAILVPMGRERRLRSWVRHFLRRIRRS